MVKADVRKDYYADLGLSPSAEENDIKKQFRKLALKYHPDRNPGKETEFNAKFQAIQAAHEILSDPQQRLKYDTDRLRAGYGKVSGPSKTNTSRRTQPTSFKPTPPRPQYNPSPFAKPQSTPSGPSAGAKRYEAHARAGPQSWHKPRDEAQTRADAFKGFSGMRGSHAGGGAGWQGFDPNTGRATTGGTPRQQNQPFGKPRPQSAYQRFQESYKTQTPSSDPHSPKKRNGYAPGASGDDEPMARNTSAYTSSSRPSSMYFDPAPPPTARKPAATDQPHFPQEYERASSRYATAGGEKTFFTSSGLGRSSTVRTPSGGYRTSNARTNPSSPASAQKERHRSASPKTDRNREYSISDTSSDLDDLTSEDDIPQPRSAFNPKPKAVPKSRMRHRQKFTDLHGQNDSSSSTGHNSDSAAFPKFQQAQFNNSTSRPDSAQTKPTAQPMFGQGSPSNLHKKFSEEDWRDHLDKFDFLGSNPAKQGAFRASPKGSTDRFDNRFNLFNPTPSSQNRGQETSGTNSTQSATTAGSPGLNPFSPTGVNGTQPQPQPQSKQAPTPFAQAKFSADQWNEQLRNLSWNVADANKPRQANTPPLRSPKKPAKPGVKVRSGPQPASVATEAEEIKETINGSTPPESAQPPPAQAEVEPEAMDLDDEVPPVHPTASAVPGQDSTSGSANTSYPDLNGHATEATSAASKPPASVTHTTMNGATKTEARAPLFNLDNLRNTAPFTSTNSGGIENLEDVFATLPFESKARQQTTTKRDIRPRELKLPNPPKRPRAPELVPIQPGSQQFVLPRDKWNYYVSTMGSYMRDWNIFNRRILLHFNTRQEAIETGLSPGWISAVGDTARLRMNGNDDDAAQDKDQAHADPDIIDSDELVPDKRTGGYSAYLRGIEEDTQVRKHWEVACELHRECILDLGRLREWIRNGGKVV